ncbi:MAG: ribonuclease III [Dehalogenimonas sp.]
MDNYSKLQDRLGVRFNDPALLELALIHSSYVNETPDNRLVPNERLEFLGDAVLGVCIAERLYVDFPSETEGTLTRYRSLLVRRDTLSRLAEEIGLGDALFMGRGEISTGGRKKPANLARALEALIAAVYLDQGHAAAAGFIDHLFTDAFKQLVQLSAFDDSKSRLQELIQGEYHTTPEYRITQSTGAAHRRTFTAEVSMDGRVLGMGQGLSKKEAESAAAGQALEYLGNTLHFD